MPMADGAVLRLWNHGIFPQPERYGFTWRGGRGLDIHCTLGIGKGRQGKGPALFETQVMFLLPVGQKEFR